MDPALEAALALTLADLAATCAITLLVEDTPWSDLGPSAMLWTTDRQDGTGISIMKDDTPAEQIVGLADQVQEAAIEALWMARLPVTWPQCPHHPDTHPLEPVLVSGAPTWRCPDDGGAIAAIGGLDRG
jgi:hypothetical protein